MIHDGRDLFVRCNLHDNTSVVVVTFSPMLQAREVPTLGFAEAALNKHGISNIVFVARWNHWWQTDEMEDALARARAVIADCRPGRVAGYGSSMGAYGALLFSGALGMSEVYAFGPQYSIDPAKVPFETRWGKFARAIVFSRDDMDAALQSAAQKYVFYDPFSVDKRHIALMQGRALHKMRVPFGGHAVARFFKETGKLKAFFEALIRGDDHDSLARLVREARKLRGNSVIYKIALVDALGKAPHHQRTRLVLAQRFARENMRAFKLRDRLCAALLDAGDLKGARKHAEAGCRLNKANFSSLVMMREVLLAEGNAAEAADLARQIERARAMHDQRNVDA